MTAEYYHCAPFYLMDAGGRCLLMTASMGMEIENAAFWQLLQAMSSIRCQSCSRVQLEKWCEAYRLNLDDVIVMLTDELMLCRPMSSNKINYVVLDINDLAIHDLLLEDVAAFSHPISYDNAADYYGNDQALIICYRQQYDDTYFETALQRLAAKQYIVTAGLAQRFLQIDNLYSPDSGLPSHFSHLYQLQQLIRTPGLPLEQDNWMRLSRELCQLGVSQLPVITPAKSEKGYIAFCLLRFISGMVNPAQNHFLTQDQNKLFWTVDLSTGNVFKEVAVHSPYDWTLSSKCADKVA